MNYNYHTHTYRCHHATGTPEEYINVAINGGIKFMGFSDHAPFVFPDGYQSPFRVPFNEAKEYFAELNALREKYKDRIDIKIGFEMEYYKSHFKRMLKTVTDFGAEYIILGQHFVFEEHPDGVSSIAKTDNVSVLKDYTKSVLEGMKSGYYTYVAHPDMLNFAGDKSLYIKEMRKICIASREENIPLELNFLGIRGGRNYPNDTFWKIAGEEQSPVTYGFDAHGKDAACDKASLTRAKELTDKYDLNYIGKPQIRLLK